MDLVRVVAIGLVFYSHAVRGMVKGVLIGNVGVELFFVLSGFLVGRYFFVSGQEYNLNFAFKFMAKRWLRTLPLYYAVIIMKLILTKHTFSESWPYFVFIQNYVSLSFFSVSWSLSIEEWFYVLLPLMGVLVIKSTAHVSRIIAFIAVIYCIELFLRTYYVLNDHTPWETITAAIHLRMDSLLTGLALVFIKYEYVAFYNKLKSFWVFCFGALMVALYLYAFATNYLVSQINTVIFFRIFGFVLLSISMALLFPFIETISIGNEKLPGRMINRMIIAGSILTYSFYLIHSEVIEWFSALQIRLVGKVAGAFIVSVILSWLLYLCIEKPFLDMKNRIKIDRN
jgi:peptidoglycan/LPS O-acetylase OafA/YrhL